MSAGSVEEVTPLIGRLDGVDAGTDEDDIADVDAPVDRGVGKIVDPTVDGADVDVPVFDAGPKEIDDDAELGGGDRAVDL